MVIKLDNGSLVADLGRVKVAYIEMFHMIHVIDGTTGEILKKEQFPFTVSEFEKKIEHYNNLIHLR